MTVGRLAIVLHAHLPWLAGHGVWPVGEEWLYQAWAGCYLRLADLLHGRAEQGRRGLLTLGVTPVLAAQLDDGHCLQGMATWLGLWQLRAAELAGRPRQREAAAREHRDAAAAIELFDRRWRSGGSPVLRGLADSGVVELLGGPLTHPFLPLIDDRIAGFALRSGLDDAALRWGRRPDGVWAPECGYRPGLEQLLAASGVRHVVVDEVTAARAGRGTTAGWRLGTSEVVAFPRDLALTDRVWSSRTGYPSAAHYRDFHARDPELGSQLWAVTGSPQKHPYDPRAAAALVERHARDFVDAVRAHLAAADRPRPLAVVAWDAELFGHWWHEGPAFLGRVLDLLPDAGVLPCTLAEATQAGCVGGRVDLGPGSWGAGKDFRLWAGEQVADLVEVQEDVQKRLLRLAEARATVPGRDRLLDGAAREALLALSSDWAFMVSRDSAATYALDRLRGHAERFGRWECGDAPAQRAPRPFGHLDARLLDPR